MTLYNLTENSVILLKNKYGYYNKLLPSSGVEIDDGEDKEIFVTDIPRRRNEISKDYFPHYKWCWD